MGEPRHDPPAVESVILHDCQRRTRSRVGSRLRDSLGLRASLPRVQGVADTAHPQDGLGGCRLPSRIITLPRRRRAPVVRGVL